MKIDLVVCALGVISSACAEAAWCAENALVPATPGCIGPVSVCAYPKGAEAAFMLAFDDACASHLQNAIPLLEKYRVPGTFYVITEAGQFSCKKPEWAKAAKSPYVFLGNHTSTHKGVNAPEELPEQLDAANAVIRELTPENPWPRLMSFAIPGGVPWRIDKAALTDVLSTRDLVERPGFQGPPWFCAKVEEAEAYVDTCLAERKMGHLDFHGIGGDWHVAGLDYFESLLKKLDAVRDRMWLCSAIDWHKYVTEKKHARIQATPKGRDSLILSISLAPLDIKLYNHPITVEIQRPWPAVKIESKGESRVIQATDGRLLVPVLPGEFTLTCVKSVSMK